LAVNRLADTVICLRCKRLVTRRTAGKHLKLDGFTKAEKTTIFNAIFTSKSRESAKSIKGIDDVRLQIGQTVERISGVKVELGTRCKSEGCNWYVPSRVRNTRRAHTKRKHEGDVEKPEYKDVYVQKFPGVKVFEIHFPGPRTEIEQAIKFAEEEAIRESGGR